MLDISDWVDESVIRLYQAVEIRDLMGEVVAVLIGGLVAEADAILKGTGAVLSLDELAPDDGLDVELVGCKGCVTIVSTLGVRREIVGMDLVNGAVVMQVHKGVGVVSKTLPNAVGFVKPR